MKIQCRNKLHQKGKKEINYIKLERMLEKCKRISRENGNIKNFMEKLSNIKMEYRDDKCYMVLIDNDDYKYLERIIGW